MTWRAALEKLLFALHVDDSDELELVVEEMMGMVDTEPLDLEDERIIEELYNTIAGRYSQG